MTIERGVVELWCDECSGQEGEIVGATVTEVKAKAREQGWTLNANGDFCHCNVRGWRGEQYRARKGEVEAEREFERILQRI